ncbi:MAG: copper homeostasis protein CutC [Flavobacterium sp.]|nr:copper homeostasis protein CutC [Pedobacter sp.]
MGFELEICCNSINSAIAANKGGADRIELCDNMSEGGTTPSHGLIQACKNLLTIPVFVMIRPRGGDFLYNDEEFEVMKLDVMHAKKSDCDGIVIGILKSNGSIDMDRCRQLIELARPMKITFHRAFDRCENPLMALEDIISLGCQRVLTSGAEVSAANAIATLGSLIKQAANRVMIMAGSGINETNLAFIAQNTGIRSFHSTGKTTTQSNMIYFGAGKLAELDGHFPVLETSSEKVRRMKFILAELLKDENHK